MSLLRIALALAALLVTSTVNAQAPEQDWRVIRPGNTGIPGEELYFVSVAPDDSIWLGARFPFWSEGGAANFDGTNWTTYSNFDGKIPSEWVQSASFAPDGSTWFGTSGGLVRLDSDGVTTVFDSSNSGMPTDEVKETAVDSTGRVWGRYFKSGGFPAVRGVVTSDGTTVTSWHVQDIGLPAFSDFYGPVVDKNDHVWIGVTTGGMARYDGSTWELFNASTGHSDSPVAAVAVDPAGDVWARWWLGIMKFDGESWIDMPDPPTTDSWSSFAVTGSNTYWVGTFSGLVYRYTPAGWLLVLEGGQPFPSWITGIDVDSSGDVWIATLKAGLRHLDVSTGGWTTYNRFNTGLASYFTSGIATDLAGDAWIATAGGGISKMEGRPEDFEDAIWRGFGSDNGGSEPWPFGYGTPQGTDSVEDVAVAPNGDVWIASNGVARWDGTAWEAFGQQTSDLWTNSTEVIDVDATGDVWVGFYNAGVDRYDGESWTHYGLAEGLPGLFVEDITHDAAGRVFVATNGGLGVFDAGEWTAIEVPGLPFSATAVAVAPNGDLWVGTPGGLGRLGDQGWTTFDASTPGFPADYVYSVDVAPNGVVWVGAFDISTFPLRGGVGRFDGASWSTYDTGNSPLPHNQAERVEVDADGNVWIVAQSEGVAVVLAEPSLRADVGSLSLVGGGSQTLDLFAGPVRSGDVYWMFGSATGTSPGIPLAPGVTLPLEYDPYFALTLKKPFAGPFGSFLGTLDVTGAAQASFDLPVGSDPSLAGLTLYHAYASGPVLGTSDFASVATELTLAP